MTFKKLLTMAAAIMMAGSMWAQFTDGGKYYFYNVEAGKWLAPGNNWGTQASLLNNPEFVKLHFVSDGVYTIETQVSNGGSSYYFAGGYMDGSATNFTFTANGEYYTITNGANVYGYDGTTTVLSNAATGDNAKWQIFSEEDMYSKLATASETNPVDATWLMLDPTLGRNNRNASAWVRTNSSDIKTSGDVSGSNANFLIEAYCKTFDVHQTLTVPNGYYKLTARAFYRKDGADEKLPYIYANDIKENFPAKGDDPANNMQQAAATFAAGNFITTTAMVTVKNKTLTIGAATEGTGCWAIFDTFSLTYYGPLDLPTYASALSDAITAAKAVDQSAKMSTIVLANLQSAISTYETASYDNADDYETAIDAVNKATNAAKASINSYKVIAAGVVPDNSLEGWVCENSNTFHINTWSGEGNSDGSNMKTPFIENWVARGSYLGAGKVYYKLEGLEPGEVYYAQALVRSYNEASSDAPNGPNFFINDQVVDMTSEGTTFTYNNMSGIYATLGGAAIVGSDGTLTLGVEIASNRNYNWVAFKSVTIQELGAAYDAAVAKVTALEGKIPTAEYAKAQAVVAANTTVSIAAIDAIEAAVIEAQEFITPYATAKGLVAAAQAIAASYPNIAANATAMNMAIEAATDVATLNEYISKMNVAITIFNEWLAVKAGAEKLAAVPNDNPAANTGFVNTIAKKEADVQAVSDLSDAAVVGTTTNQLKSEILNYVADANPTGDNKFELTFLLTNPNLEGLPTWQKADGWKTEQTDGNSQVMINDNATSEDGTKKAFFEYWSNPPQTNGKFALYLETTLPEGTYNMSCYAFSQNESGGGHVQKPNGVYFYANDTQGSAINSLRLAPASIEFVNASEQSVKIGLKTVAGNGNTWMGIGYVELYKVAPKSFEIAETANYDASTEGAGDVKVTRTIKAGYNTLVLPFSLTQEEVETAFGAGSKVYEISKYENENITFAVRSGIVANEPVILYATAAGTEYTFPGRTVVATSAPVKTVDEVKFVGNYETGYAVAKDVNNYILSDGKFYLVTTDVTLKTTRAFITVPASAPVAARLNITFEDGDATAIDQIATETTTVKGIYNLQGQQLGGLQRGINIVNGKKVLVK